MDLDRFSLALSRLASGTQENTDLHRFSNYEKTQINEDLTVAFLPQKHGTNNLKVGKKKDILYWKPFKLTNTHSISVLFTPHHK